MAWREEAAAHPPRRFAGESYWAAALPGFGDPEARVLLVGLAPAAHGGNRTGRLFTGDRSGDFLFAALHRTGLANQPSSDRRDDGLTLRDAYVAAVVRCAPPDNKPLPEERASCLPYLVREIELLARLRVIVALGGYAWEGTQRALAACGFDAVPGRAPGRGAAPGRGFDAAAKPAFGHGAAARVGPFVLLGSFHPSQQNTFTGRLTPAMLDAVLLRAREVSAG